MAVKNFSGAIKGLDEIKAKLRKLDSDMVRNINRSAARAGAVAIKKEADSNLPSKHRGKRKVDVSAKRRTKRDYFSFKVGAKAEHWALAFLEYGAKPHDIGPKARNSLRLFNRDGANASNVGPVADVAFIKKVHHPGIQATRWLSRSIAEGAEIAFKAIGDQYWKRIKKATK